MDKGNRQHLQDIYSTDQITQDEFTPQVSEQTIEEHKRDIRRHKLTGFILGSTVLVLVLVLIYIIAKRYIDIQKTAPSPTPITQSYIPRHSLPSDTQWVLDFSRNFGNPEWIKKDERPLSAERVCRAAHNIILARQAKALDQNEDAVGYYEDALEILPDLEGVKMPLGMLYFELEKFDKALALLEDLPEEDLTPDVLNNLGAACMTAEAYVRAEAYLMQAIKAKPSYANAQKNLAELYKASKREEEAVLAYEEYLALRPGDIDAMHSLALYLTKLGRWERAAELLGQLTTEITDVAILYFLQARAETQLGNSKKALAALRRGIQLTDSDAALAWMDDEEFELLRNTDDFQVMIKALETPQK